MKNETRYYVCTRTCRAGDEWTPVAGPFRTREEAKRAAVKYERFPKGADGTFDIRRAVLVTVFSRTELTLLGYPMTPRGEEQLSHIDCA